MICRNPSGWPGHFAEMLEAPFPYRERQIQAALHHPADGGIIRAFAGWQGTFQPPLFSMLVMLAYDTPEQRHQNFLRKEFERMGGTRVQYSIYLFNGEPHECERVIRYMQRVAKGIPGDIRLFADGGLHLGRSSHHYRVCRK
jgi:CRISPR/Cas system-associated endoribonuclease Cas2